MKLAYSSLVRSAAAAGDQAVTWLCVDALLKRLEALASRHLSSKDQMPLRLTLVSLISCVPLSLLSRVLSEVERVMDSVDDNDRVELGKAILEELTHKVGEREKEAVLSWWCRVASDSLNTQESHIV